MVNKKTIVVTTYGHGKTIDKIAFCLFEAVEEDYLNEKESDARTYCDMMNSLELKGGSWISARQVAENTQYALGDFLPCGFSEIILKLDNFAIQKVLKEIDRKELAKALSNQDEAVKEKIFENMSKRGSQMLQEDMEILQMHDLAEIKKIQEKILRIVRFFERGGIIVIPDDEGETAE